VVLGFDERFFARKNEEKKSLWGESVEMQGFFASLRMTTLKV